MNRVAEILTEAIKLKPKERILLIEGLVKSIDEPDINIDQIWLDEAQSRLRLHRMGKTRDIVCEDVFGEKI